MYALQKGQGQPHVYPDDIGLIKVPIPPLNVQKKIIDIYNDSYNISDEHIKSNEDLDTKINELQERIESSNYDYVPLGEVADVAGGKRIPKGKSFSKSVTDYPYLRVSDFKDFKINSDTVKYVDKKVYDQISNYTISKEDIYISIAGTLGIVGMVGDQYDGQLLTENAAKIVTRDINNRYLMYILSTSKIQNTILNRGVGTPKLSLELIRDIQIPYPSNDQQVQIAKEFDDLYSQKYENNDIIFKEYNSMKNKVLDNLK